jgi:cholesterol transport system auxiliary component
MSPRPSALLRLAAVALLAAGLSGCISLLPKSKPAQLYRFGLAAGEAPASPRAIGVYRANGAFQRESAGDRILTITGERAAYIAQARWVAPAEVLFDEALATAFDTGGGRVRLVTRGEPARSDYALRVDVRDFETRYDGATPRVVIRLRALLTRDQNRAVVGEQIFEATVPASENRVSAIVAAYDKALQAVLGQLVGWTNATVGTTPS